MTNIWSELRETIQEVMIYNDRQCNQIADLLQTVEHLEKEKEAIQKKLLHLSELSKAKFDLSDRLKTFTKFLQVCFNWEL